MNNDFLMIQLGELLTKSEEWIDIKPEEKYKQVTVKLWGKGIVQRDEVNGTEIAAVRRLAVKPRQFIISKIDARNGASGLIPASLDGAVVSSDFPVFTLNMARILPEFLDWMSKTHDFIEICSAASEGTTNRVRLKESKFLDMYISLPPLTEQRRIVARIEELASRIEEARGLRREAVEEGKMLLSASLEKLFTKENVIKWSVKKLEQEGLATVIAGQHIMAEEYNLSGIGFPYLTGPADFGATVPVISRWTQNPKATALPGDVLLTVKGAGVGKINYAPDFEVAIGRQLMAIRPVQSKLLQAFVYFFLAYKFKHFQSIATATTVPGFKKSDVEELQIPVPEIAEQCEIVTNLNDIQAKVDALKQLQAETTLELDALLPSVLDKAFKGQL